MPSAWGVWPPLVVLAGGLVAVDRFLAPLPSPLFFLGGGVCLFLPLPSLGWRTDWPAFSVVFRVAVGGCVLLGRVPAPWVGWVMYTLGSAPLPAGLGPGSAGWAAAPGGFVWLWVRGLGLSVSFLLRGAGLYLLGGPPPLLPGARWPRVWPAVPVCGVLVRRLPGSQGGRGRGARGGWGGREGSTAGSPVAGCGEREGRQNRAAQRRRGAAASGRESKRVGASEVDTRAVRCRAGVRDK